MPKNKGKGGKNRKRGTNKNEEVKRDLVKKEEGQEYGQVTKMLGNGRIECLCLDGVKRLGTIRGKMRKKIWVNHGDIVLLGLRDYQDKKGDVIGKYQPDEVKKLIDLGEITESFGMFQSKAVQPDDQSIIQFANVEEPSGESQALSSPPSDSDSETDSSDSDSDSDSEDEKDAKEESDDEDEDSEEEEEEEVERYQKPKPKVKDKRQLRTERKAEGKKGGGPAKKAFAAPSRPMGSGKASKGGAAPPAEKEAEIDIDAI